MRVEGRTALFVATMVAVASSAASAIPDVRISEIHYDNTGTDTGEAVEISGPAGTNVAGWTVVLYNGNGGVTYTPLQTLTGTIPSTANCGARGVIVLNYASNGIQNGSPDGLALVDAANNVIEFLSYEGTFTATNGPALGITSTDIGVSEAGTEAIGMSLQRNPDGTWTGPIANTFGSCNDNGTAPPPPVVASVTVAPASASITAGGTQAFTATAFDASSQPITGVTFTWASSPAAVATVNASGLATGVSAGDATITATAPNGVAGTASLHVNAATPGMPATRFSEVHYDNGGTDVGEAIEIEGPAGTSLDGWSVVLYDGTNKTAYSTTPLSGTIPATCSPRGVVVLNYATNGIQNGSPDGMALVDAANNVIEFLSYEGTFTAVGGPAGGMLSTDIIASEASSSPIGQSLQRDSFNVWALKTSTFGACNGDGTAPPPANTISFSGRVPSDPALPVGFEAQIFATERTAGNAVVQTSFTWSSETPAIASIDQNGVIHALAAGTLIVRATATDGITATYSLPTRVPVASTTAHYDGNTEFGEPADSDPSDDFIVRHAEYTASYNPNRGSPNWVSYDLDASAFGDEDRCNCFTFDPDLPATFTHLTTNDYTGAGTFAGYGIDRGHMTRSFDRTSASLDNAFTFLLSNVVPQASDLNQGPWASLENDLGDLARFENKEVYIVTGPAGNKGTVKGEGKIVIPTSTWKVAVIMARDHGLDDIRDYRDLEVIAVNMPNDPGVRNVPWQNYQTTVDAIEQLTGYDLLSLLPPKVQSIVEAGIKPPLAFADGPWAGSEGSTISMSAAASVDPNGTVVDYAWDFGDGSTGSGPTVSHTWAQYGTYTVTVVVTDNDGLTDTLSTTATVSDVAPVIAAFDGAVLLPGELYSASGFFTDPGADPWTATVDYGDGSGPGALALSGRSFALAHTYAAIGEFTVTVQVFDGVATAVQTQTVMVIAPAAALDEVSAQIAQLEAAGALGHGQATSLLAKLQAAEFKLGFSTPTLALVHLRDVLIELDQLVRQGRLTAADAAPLIDMVTRAVQSIIFQAGG